MRAATRKLTTAAVCTALALVMCVCAAYLPLSIMPLYIAAFCIFLACKRGSLIYGILSAIATVGLMFVMTGLTLKWFFMLIMFAPYGLLAYFIHKYNYFKPKSGAIRAVVVLAFFNLTLFFVYLIATRVMTVGLDVPIVEWVNRLGGYWAVALIGTVALLPLDFVFSSLSHVVLKRIPASAPVRERGKAQGISDIEKTNIYGDGNTENSAADAKDQDDAKYDIFGYEIKDDKENKEK